MNWPRKILTLLLVLCGTILVPKSNAFAQVDDDFEVYLDFSHRGIINAVVTTYYRNDEFYLPLADLFTLFQIENELDGLTVSGKFGTEQVPYRVDLSRNRITFGDEVFEITAEDYLIKELGYFVRAEIFQTAFELEFTIDFNSLSLNLSTFQELPIIERTIRQQRRRIANDNRIFDERYDLRYGREKSFLDGGFFDYNFASIINPNSNTQNLNFNSNLGLQLLSGDLQGTFFGNYSSELNNFETRNLRWRLVDDNPYLTKFIVGQSGTDGVLRNDYTGIRITNEPIERRRIFDEFELQGRTIPESEVELYLNNALIDFQQTNTVGDYRFLIPITYGTTQYSLRIYGPTGQLITRDNRIQVPFSFQPEGVFNYYLNVGRLDNPIIGFTDTPFTVQGTGSYGISSWLTSKIGVEYFEGSNNNTPTISSTLSSRIRQNYVLSAEYVSNAYLRSMLNVIYPNSASINVDYINFEEGQSIYNSSNESQRLVTSIYYPFQFGNFPFNLRVSTFSRYRGSINNTTFRMDANSRIGKINLKVGYTDRMVNSFTPFSPSGVARIDNAITYSLPRSRSFPKLLRGALLRAQAEYLPKPKEFLGASFSLSQSAFDRGRFQVAYERNFITGFDNIRASLIIDFGKIRSSTSVNTFRSETNITQRFRGSVGFDSNNNNFVFTSRDQVGRSGTAIKLFVDNNNNGTFEKDIDSEVDGNAVRIQRSGASTTNKGGLLYFTQMQPYFYYNLEVNKGAIANPLLIPEFDKFGVITDPNRFKNIEIPFYLSGVMDGVVERVYASGEVSGIGGLKVQLTGLDRDITKEIRTYSDGSFYDYELPPGSYTLSVDQTQLDFLNVNANPEKIEFVVEAKSEGDFIEGLNFTLEPREVEELDEESEQERITIAQITDEIRTAPEVLDYSQEIFLTIDQSLRYIIQAQNAFYSKNIDVAFHYVTESLELFETAQGHALKGSFYYFEGNIEQAQRHWEQALRFNPDLYIPDMETLEERVNTGASD